ncbi:MAG: hypothetical protein ACXVJO_06845 [Thermoanaerobaculia bacterium]
MIEVDELRGPQAVADFFAGDHLAGVLEEKGQESHGLILQRHANAAPAQLACMEIEVEDPEARDAWSGLQRRFVRARNRMQSGHDVCLHRNCTPLETLPAVPGMKQKALITSGLKLRPVKRLADYPATREK